MSAAAVTDSSVMRAARDCVLRVRAHREPGLRTKCAAADPAGLTISAIVSGPAISGRRMMHDTDRGTASVA